MVIKQDIFSKTVGRGRSNVIKLWSEITSGSSTNLSYKTRMWAKKFWHA